MVVHFQTLGADVYSTYRSSSRLKCSLSTTAGPTSPMASAIVCATLRANSFGSARSASDGVYLRRWAMVQILVQKTIDTNLSIAGARLQSRVEAGGKVGKLREGRSVSSAGCGHWNTTRLHAE